MTHVYVAVTPDEEGFPPVEAEEIDAVRLSATTARIQGIPVFVVGLSCADVVRVVHNLEDDRLWITEVLEPSRHWTTRVVPLTNAADGSTISMPAVAQRFRDLGCHTLQSPYRIVAVDVPPRCRPIGRVG